MAEHGHIKLSRKAYAPLVAGGDPFWNESREFSRWEAWEYLIQAAAYADHKRRLGGGPVMIPRGHTPPMSLSYLATAWGWTTKRVRGFLDLLVEMDRIRAVGGDRTGTTYLLLNYDHYQSTPEVKYEVGHAEGTAKGTLRGIVGGTAKPSIHAGSDASGAQLGAQFGAQAGVAKGQQREALEANTDIGGDKSPRPKRSRELPESWTPSTTHRDQAGRLGLDLEDQVERFRDFHTAKGSVMKDWDAAFRTWLRNAPRFGGRDTGSSGPVALDAGVWA